MNMQGPPGELEGIAKHSRGCRFGTSHRSHNSPGSDNVISPLSARSTRTAASTWLCTSPTSTPALCRTSSRNSTAGTSFRSLVNPVTPPSGAFCLRFVFGMMNAFGLVSYLRARWSLKKSAQVASHYVLRTERFLNDKVIYSIMLHNLFYYEQSYYFPFPTQLFCLTDFRYDFWL